MKKQFHGLTKGFFKRTFAVVLVLCMLAALVPKNSLFARAKGTTENLALSATVSSNAVTSGVNKLNDGDHNTAIWRSGAAADLEGKDYYQLNWTSPVSVDQVVLVATKARNQGPTAWRVQISKDGETAWTDVASVSDVAWAQLGDVKESQKLTFNYQKDIKGIRVWINKANLTYNGYGIQEIEAYNISNGNYAISASMSSNAVTSGVNKLNDGDHNTAIWRSGTASDIEGKDYYQLNWTNPVSTNEVILTATKARNQGPTSWHVQVSEDGVNNWTDVASVSDIEWKELGDVKESSKLTFVLQENIKGIRVWIDKANLAYSGYGIQEIEVYNDPTVKVEPAPTPGENPEAPKKELPENGNYAYIAEVTTNIEKVDRLTAINDGDHGTALWRAGAAADIEGKDYYQFNWTDPVSVNELVLVATKARNQSPVAWRVQVSQDGETAWTDVASVSDAGWKELGDVKETNKLTFALQENIKGIRVWIDKANLAYSGYGIQEIEIYNDPAVTADQTPENGNYALVAEITTNVGKVDRLTDIADGKADTALWRAGAAADIEGKDYYQFNWKNPVSISQVILTATKARNQAPTAWHVQVSKDGVNDWKDVGSVTNAQWKNLGDIKESNKLTFTLQTDIKGVRVVIDKANLTWGGYAIQEIEMYNGSKSPSSGDNMPVAPIMLAVLFSAAGVVTCTFENRKNRKRIGER